MNQIPRAKLLYTSSYLPPRVIKNREFEEWVETNDEWIISRTGIRERRICTQQQATYQMGVEAAKKLLNEYAVRAEEIDAILVSTMSPDSLCPATASKIQYAIGASHACACDLQAACSGFLYALSLAKGWIESGMYGKVLIVCSEKMSRLLDYTDRSTCVLFGDGACAALLSSEGEGFFLRGLQLGSDGGHAPILTVPEQSSPAPWERESREPPFPSKLQMDGRATYRQAVSTMVRTIQETLQKLSLQVQDIEWFVAHQANLRILETVAQKLELPQERIALTLHKYGNCSSASLGITLDELLHEQQEANHILLASFGGGVNWGSLFLQREREFSASER